jgi:competence protein ComEA
VAWLIAIAGVALVGNLVGAAAVRNHGDQKPPAAQQANGKSDEQEEELARVGEETTDRVCKTCHTLENITRMRRTSGEWEEVITTMTGRGANATEDEFETIKQYLIRWYGVVRINTAAAKELSAVLGLSAKDAEAVVQYRKAHGNFADAAALASVPGIDKAKIEAQPEALRFD